MIVVKIYGGLGNQMFQYATASILSKKLSTRLYCDLSWYQEKANRSGIVQRHYELDQFGINTRKVGFLAKLKRQPTLFKESYQGYDPMFGNLNGDILLDGYWQSYKYFENYELLVRQLFQFPKLKTNQNLRGEITSSQSISMHIRRGDYAANPKTKAIHGLMPMSYYMTAIKRASKNLKAPKLFVFSDEPSWAKANLKLPLPTVFVERGHNVDDMHLMSLCKQNIIANSSFSWWSAWLNENPRKQVIAPKQWFNDASLKNPDLLPREWAKL